VVAELDASALVELAHGDADTAARRDLSAHRPRRASAALGRVEVARAVRSGSWRSPSLDGGSRRLQDGPPRAAEEGCMTDEAGRLVAAYRERQPDLEPLRRMLGTPGDQFTRDQEDRAANDAMVADLADDLRSLAKHTKRWLRWAAREVARRESEADHADEASLAAAVATIDAVRARARELVDEAVTALDVVQRASLARHMISDLGYADRLWAPHAAEERASLPSHQTRRGDKTVAYTRLDEFVDGQLDHFRSMTAGWTRREELPSWMQRDIQWARLRGGPLLRLWRRLNQPMQTIQLRGREIDAVHERVTYAHAQAAAARRHAERDAERERQRQEEQAEAEQKAGAARRVEQETGALDRRAEAFERSWTLPSRTRHECPRSGKRDRWLDLRPLLCDGIFDADGEPIVRGIPREQADHVLALLYLAGESGRKAADRLAELLAEEDELVAERARLYQAAVQAPVAGEVYTTLAKVRPDLRRAYEWLTEHADHVLAALQPYAPDEATSLAGALDELQRRDR
jgi:hypothetical protein